MSPMRWTSPMFLFATLLVTPVAVAGEPAAPSGGEGVAAAASPGNADLRGDDPEAEAQAYLDAWNKEGAPVCAKRDAGCEAKGELLWKAAAQFEAARRRDKAMGVRKLILDPRFHLESTAYGKKAAFELAQDYQSIAEYAEAAALHEAAAQRFPAEAPAPDGLLEAVTLRLGLGDLDRATEDAEVFDKLYGAKRSAQAVKLRLGIVAFLIDKEAFGEARGRLERLMARIDRDGDLGDRIQAHAWLGRSLAKLDDAKRAEREYGIVRALWKEPQVAMKALAGAGDGDAAQARRLGNALTAVGEAIFFFAEKKRVELDAIRYPIYKGPATREQISAHVGTQVAGWIRKKREAIEATEGAYREVLALQPAPPPRWVIASGARVGQMWGKFVAEFRAAPIPREWMGNRPAAGPSDMSNGALRSFYYQQVDAASEPLKQRARGAFATCVDHARKFQFFDEHVRSCEVWLAKNYGAEFSLVAELRPALGGYGWSLRASPAGEAVQARRPERPASP